MLSAVAGVAMGLDLDERLRFDQLAPYAAGYSVSGKPSYITGGETRTEDEARWCIEHVARHAYRLEETYPDMKEEPRI
jgi:hypothetical protein